MLPDGSKKFKWRRIFLESRIITILLIFMKKIVFDTCDRQKMALTAVWREEWSVQRWASAASCMHAFCFTGTCKFWMNFQCSIDLFLEDEFLDIFNVRFYTKTPINYRHHHTPKNSSELRLTSISLRFLDSASPNTGNQLKFRLLRN